MAEAGDSFTTLLQTNTAELLNLFDGESLTDMFQGISGKGGIWQLLGLIELRLLKVWQVMRLGQFLKCSSNP